MSETKKPEVIVTTGNVFWLVSAAIRALKEAGWGEKELKEFSDFTLRMKSYEDIVKYLSEYVDFVIIVRGDDGSHELVRTNDPKILTKVRFLEIVFFLFTNLRTLGILDS